jgi:thioredoxin-dependent peroxiredoxin
MQRFLGTAVRARRCAPSGLALWLGLAVTGPVVALAAGRPDAGVVATSAQPPAPPDVPAVIAAPKGAMLTARLHATGVQIYTCAPSVPGAVPGTVVATPSYAWTLKAPEAALTDAAGALAARHSAGPTWTSVDGSAVVGKKLAQSDAPAADAIPWLLVRATATSGTGIFTGVTFIQRVATSKGKPPASGCDAKSVGAEARVDYTADYAFYKSGAPEQQVLAVGTPAPAFKVVAHDGHTVTLGELKGKYVVLYFYPKDETAGCTKEACEFRDNWSKLQKLGVAVFGVSTQDNASHRAFAEKYKLPFPLLPDEKGELAAKYLVPVDGGKAKRTTYLIGKDGRIAHVWTNVNPVGHAGEILREIGPG